MPSSKPPVALLIQPTRAGPTAPEIVPIVLMMAMPPAAAVPDKYNPGAAQIIGMDACTPAVAIVRQIIPNRGLWENLGISAKPNAPIKAGTTKCQRSSFFASE